MHKTHKQRTVYAQNTQTTYSLCTKHTKQRTVYARQSTWQLLIVKHTTMMHRGAIYRPGSRRKSMNRTSWSTSVRRMGSTRHRFRRKTCRWPEVSKPLCLCDAEWPSSWWWPRSCRRHWNTSHTLKSRLVDYNTINSTCFGALSIRGRVKSGWGTTEKVVVSKRLGFWEKIFESLLFYVNSSIISLSCIMVLRGAVSSRTYLSMLVLTNLGTGLTSTLSGTRAFDVSPRFVTYLNVIRCVYKNNVLIIISL